MATFLPAPPRSSALGALLRAARYGLLLAAWLLAGPGARAQSTVTGQARDAQKPDGLPFANVLLRAGGPAGKVVQAVLADDAGRFALHGLAPGHYQLQVLAVGYTTAEQALDLVAGAPTLALGPLALPPAAQKLGEVVVTARKPLIEQKPDRVTMHVDGSILAAGNSAYDILAAAPAVQLIDGRLTMRGKSGVLILLNGKRLPSGTSLETVLASIPGDQIERVELISNPSAKYDADAAGGVIEIYTKRAKELGWTANVGANARQGHRTGAGLNGGMRASSPKFDLAASGSYSRRGGFERTTGTRTLFEGRAPVAGLVQRGNIDKVSAEGSFSGSINYHPRAATTVGLDVDLLTGSLAGTGDAQADLTRGAAFTASNIRQDVLLQETFNNYTAFYKHVLDSLDSNLLLTANYATFDNRQQQEFAQRIQGPRDTAALASTFRNNIPAAYRIATTAADYTKVWGPTTRLEAGLKYTDTRNQSRQEAALLTDAGWQPQALTPFSQLGYRERVAAGYLTLHHTAGKLGLQAGLRAERTRYAVAQGIDSSYFNLFPNVRADYKASDNYTASWAYARNIQRPAYERLIPYERFIDAYTSSQGNARLRPEYAHSFSWNNLYKGYGLQLSYTQTTGAIASVYRYDAANLRFVETYQNLPRRHLASATLTAPVAPAKWWAMNNSAGVVYQELTFPDPLDNAQPYTKRKTSFNVSSDNTFTLGKGWTARLYGLYNSASAYGLFDLDAYSYVSIGIKRSFLAKRASLNLSFVDAFYQSNPGIASTVIPVVSYFANRNDTRQVRLAFAYNFGKTNLKSKRVETNSNATERGRLGQ